MPHPRDSSTTLPAPDATRPGAPSDAGETDVGRLVRAIEWDRTLLGPVESWSASLRTMVRFILANRFPLLLWWGPEYVCIYNDAYRPILGKKHPHAMGRPVKEVWSEIWHVLQPLIDRPFLGGPSTWIEEFPLEINRYGYVEETYFTVAYSPVPDESATRGIGGVLATVHEITEKVIGERRTEALRELASGATEAMSADDACTIAAHILSRHRKDVPFAMIYLAEPGGDRLRLAGASDVNVDESFLPTVVELSDTVDATALDPLHVAMRRAMRSHTIQTVDQLGDHSVSSAGSSDERPHVAAVVPISSTRSHHADGLLVAGVSPRRQFDSSYQTFFELLAAHIGTAVGKARAYEGERRRAEALAELDRAKTAFFSNVSHEFRTPLTLLLGPVSDALADSATTVVNRERLTLIQRNALRLQRLVNTMLDFARIEAGRVEARYEPTDLAAFTTDLASTFRTTVENGGLFLKVDCPPLPDPVHVDRDMWEKIVLNLISNAFKHTFEGGIIVSLRASDDSAELEVADTGVGVPADQLGSLFERFHRVPNTRSRTHEGTGIGLALVQELVRLHGGQISVRSTEGVGTTFSIRVPLGTAHLQPEQIQTAAAPASASTTAPAYAAETSAWSAAAPSSELNSTRARVLLADDNADLRTYVAQLLRQQGWSVRAVSDGREALNAARAEHPDLVLSDVMMPGLDGIELLRALRADPATKCIPIILLSARAGEESRIEGVATGADDYLTKPFSSRELVARVSAHLRLAAERRRASEELAGTNAELQSAHELLTAQIAETNRVLADQARALASLEDARREAEDARQAAESANRAKSDFLAAMSHELRTPLNAIAGHADLIDLGIHGPTTREQREAIARIRRGERHLLSLINDVLNFAKLEAGRLEYDVRDVPLRAAVDDVSAIVAPQFAAKRLTYSATIPNQLSVCADPDKLNQILLNVIGNAVKFTPEGGCIAVDALETGEDGHRMVDVLIADTGIGIAPEKHEAIFDPFVQVSRELTTPTQGTGLGLAISRNLARGMGGDLRCRSVPRQGSTFVLSLPRG